MAPKIFHGLINNHGIYFPDRINLYQNPFMHYFIIAGMGMMNGTFTVISALAWPRFFGLKYLGEVSGFAMGSMVFGTALAPFLFSKVYTVFTLTTWLFLAA